MSGAGPPPAAIVRRRIAGAISTDRPVTSHLTSDHSPPRELTLGAAIIIRHIRHPWTRTPRGTSANLPGARRSQKARSVGAERTRRETRPTAPAGRPTRTARLQCSIGHLTADPRDLSALGEQRARSMRRACVSAQVSDRPRILRTVRCTVWCRSGLAELVVRAHAVSRPDDPSGSRRILGDCECKRQASAAHIPRHHHFF